VNAAVIARRLAVAVGLASLAGCGLNHLQSARTTPRGLTRTTIGLSAAHLGDRGYEYGAGLPAIPLDLMVRTGATDRVDFGFRTLIGIGVLGDVKWNLLDPARATALSLSAGLGWSADTEGWLIHVPLTVTASHSVLPWFTPYAAVGYGTFWANGYGNPRPGVTYASRTATGDGLVMLHAGVELSRATGRALLLEYTVGFPVVNDPGDFSRFGTNQFISIAFRTGQDGDDDDDLPPPPPESPLLPVPED
jgi:hypothetical protein